MNRTPVDHSRVARLADENQRLAWAGHVLSEIAEAASGSLDLDAVLGRALRQLVKAFPREAAIIRLRNGHGDSLEPHASVGLDPLALETFLGRAAGREASERALVSGEVVVLDELAGDGPRTLICAPIVADADPVGTLELLSPVRGRFGAGDRQLLVAAGRYLGFAVQNARLYARVLRAKAEWERTADAMGDCIAVFDRSGRLVRGNVALAQTLGCGLTEVLGRSCAGIGFCGHQSACTIRAVIETEQPIVTEVVRSDGQIFAVKTLPIGGDESAAVVQIARNATDEILLKRHLQSVRDELAHTNADLNRALDQLRTAQSQLIQSEKLSAIGQLVAGVAHELNNPLTSVIGYAQLVHEELTAAPPALSIGAGRTVAEVAQDAQRAAIEAERAAKIVRSLLAFARRQTGERLPQPVEELVTRVVTLRAYDVRLNNIDLRVQVDPDLPPIFVDPNQLQQALLNIFLNAEYAVSQQPEDRVIAVAARLDPGAWTVRMEIEDSGPGIDPAVLSRIFDPFFTTKPLGKGTGLGLSICYGIVRDHGGHLWAENAPGGGARFAIQLPVRLPAGGGHPAPARVLVAHGDAANRDFLCAALAGWGHECVAAATATEAIARLQHDPIEVALVDPSVCAVESDAWASALAARDDVPLIYTGPTAEGPVARLAHGFARAHVAPPFSLGDLAAALRGVLLEECV